MNTEQTTIQRAQESTIPTEACPCCSGLPYEECCRPILAGSPAPTAEALVRSRYTAFAVRSLDHVENTHAPEIRDDFNRAEAERLAEECEWKSLRIHKAIEDGDQASVEYVMEVRKDGNTIIKGVKSDFRRENGRWLFASTKPAPQLAHALSTKVSRNDPCPCASGKKYKKCCGA